MSAINLLISFLFSILFSVSVIAGLDRTEADKETLKIETISEKKKVAEGIFIAPKVYKQTLSIINEFKKTKYVNENIEFITTLSSSSEVNAYVKVEEIDQNKKISSNLKYYKVVINKGLIDLFSDENRLKEIGLEEALRKSYIAKSESLLAAVIAHELGHIHLGHIENFGSKVLTRPYLELEADRFAVKLLAEAGYKPSAMIDVLSTLGKLYNISHMRDSIAQALQDHPKSNYRIANILELVNQLEKKSESAKSLNIKIDEIPLKAEKSIARSINEKPSKNSKESVSKKLKNQEYQSYNLENKLKYLERYFLLSSTNSSPAIIPSVEIIMLEYKSLIEKANELKEIQRILESYKKFEESNDYTRVKGKNSTKKIHKEIRVTFNKNVLSIVNKKPHQLGISNLASWADVLDQKDIIGILKQEISRLNSIQELENYILVIGDNKNKFVNPKIKILTKKSKIVNPKIKILASKNSKIEIDLFNFIFIKYLKLNPNLNEMLDFLYQVLDVENVNGEAVVKNLENHWARILKYILTENTVDLEEFKNRILNSNESKIKNFAMYIMQNRTETSALFRTERNKTADLNSSSINYGVGSKLKKKDLNTNELWLASFSLDKESRIDLLTEYFNQWIQEAKYEKVLDIANNEFFKANWADKYKNDRFIINNQLEIFNNKYFHQLPYEYKLKYFEILLQNSTLDFAFYLDFDKDKILKTYSEALETSLSLNEINLEIKDDILLEIEKLFKLRDEIKNQNFENTFEFQRLKNRLLIKLSILKADTNVFNYVSSSGNDLKVELYKDFLHFDGEIFNHLIEALNGSNKEVYQALWSGNIFSKELMLRQVIKFSEIANKYSGILFEDLSEKDFKLHTLDTNYENKSAATYKSKIFKSKGMGSPITDRLKYLRVKEGFEQLDELLGEKKEQYYKIITKKNADDYFPTLLSLFQSKVQMKAFYLLGNGKSIKDILISVSETKVLDQNPYLGIGILSHALSLVSNKQQMEEFVTYYSLLYRGTHFGSYVFLKAVKGEFNEINFQEEEVRLLFINKFIEKINEYKAWDGLKTTGKERLLNYISRINRKIDIQLTVFSDNSAKVKGVWKVLIPLIYIHHKIYKKFPRYANVYQRVQRLNEKLFTKIIRAKSSEVGAHSYISLLEGINSQILFSEVYDNEVYRMLLSEGFLKSKKLNGTKRQKALAWIKMIRSFKLRAQAYDHITKKYGVAKNNLITKFRNYINFIKALNKAKDIWRMETLEELRNSTTQIEQIKVLTKAWREYASKNASRQGISEEQAFRRTIELSSAYNKLSNPASGEIADVFIEGSKYRDSYLDDIANNSKLNAEEISKIEGFKSYNVESPIHKTMKLILEVLDENISKLSAKHQAELLLYLSGVNKEYSKEMENSFKHIVYGPGKRQHQLKKRGLYVRLADMKMFMQESHPEERMIAFLSLFVEGLKTQESLNSIEDKLLYADEKMPKYLRRIISIYLKNLNRNEKTVYLSWLLANHKGEIIKGPELVKLMIEQGGVVGAKMAQLIASHGFRLPREYQEVLEKFKAKAQKIEKINALRLIKERLPEDKFSQIKKLGKLYGAGSLKIAYGATLMDGREVVIMLARENVYSKTAREFELLDLVLKDIINDPELARDGLTEIANEVKRIVSEELNFAQEAQFMKKHKLAVENRPLVVKLFGNEVRVLVPQALEGWQYDGILVEEYVKSKGFSELPKDNIQNLKENYRFWGWTQKKLARASINEIVNQLLVYMSPKEYQNSKLILDIDPHEENQLAKSNLFGKASHLVNIDLGQTVEVNPEDVRTFVRVIGNVYLGNIDLAAEYATEFVNFKNAKQYMIFKSELREQSKIYKDPIETMTVVLENLQVDAGIGLKPEYMYFQKLFATMVGLKRHVGSEHYVLNAIVKLINTVFKDTKFAKKVEAHYRLYLRKERKNNSYLTKNFRNNVMIRGIAHPKAVSKELLDIYYNRTCNSLFSK